MERETLDRPLRVARLDATKRGDPDRGPMVTMNPADARSRLLTDGELAWVHGPRRHELATVRYDDSLRPGDVVLRTEMAVYAVALCVQLSVAVISFYTVVAAASS